MQGDLKYSDWTKMVSGIMEDTPLGRIVEIRSEKDIEMLRNLSPSQRKIRQEWAEFSRSKQLNKNKADKISQMQNLQRMLASLCGEEVST